MIRQSQLGNRILHIYVCIVLSIIINSSYMKAQHVNRVAPNIGSILEQIMDTDQNLREKFNYAFDNYGDNSSEFMLATKI